MIKVKKRVILFLFFIFILSGKFRQAEKISLQNAKYRLFFSLGLNILTVTPAFSNTFGLVTKTIFQ
jgi:hypothetical protein